VLAAVAAGPQVPARAQQLQKLALQKVLEVGDADLMAMLLMWACRSDAGEAEDEVAQVQQQQQQQQLQLQLQLQQQILQQLPAELLQQQILQEEPLLQMWQQLQLQVWQQQQQQQQPAAAGVAGAATGAAAGQDWSCLYQQEIS
jgi:hypothetical protein